MFTSMPKRCGLLSSVVAIAVLMICSCSKAPSGQLAVPTASRLPNRAASAAQISSCDSGEFILPASMVDSTPTLPAYRKGPDNLTLYLTLEQHTFKYGDPIVLEVTIANETDHPITFFRPRIISFGGDLIPSMYIISLFTVSGDPIRPEPAERDWFPGIPVREDFSVLPGRGSCIVKLTLLPETLKPIFGHPLPAGDYQASVAMYVVDNGIVEGEKEYNVTAWEGLTEPSNIVTLTVQPPSQ